jgi:putative hydrolase of the HAD superfamily
MLEAVLFDYGDTLVEYNPEWAEEQWLAIGHECAARCCRFLEERGYGTFSAAEFLQAYVRAREPYRRRWQQDEPDQPGERAFARILQSLNVNVEENVLKELADEAYVPIAALARLAEGVPDVLRELRESGLRLGVVSNTPFAISARHVFGDMRRWDDLDRYFDVILLSANGYRRKPHAEMFKRALSDLQVAPSEALFVGDEPLNDVVGARRVGMKAVLKKFAWKPYEMETVPDFVVTSLNELPRIVQEIE